MIRLGLQKEERKLVKETKISGGTLADRERSSSKSSSKQSLAERADQPLSDSAIELLLYDRP